MRPARPPPIAGPPACVFLDLPAVQDGDRPPLLHLAVAASPWPGTIASWRKVGPDSFALADILGLPAILGETLSPLPPGPVWRWDTGNTLDVRLSGGALSSVGREAALAGRNLLALLGPGGAVEILSASFAELVAPRTYRLADLLRGLGGTEAEAVRHLPSGATCVLLDEAVRPVTASLGDLGQVLTYRIGPAARDHAHPVYVERQAHVGATALKPLAPVHLRASRTADGIAIGWVRRTRLDGDGWEVADVPLGEETERYEVDILQAGLALRTLAAAEPSVLYASADEIVDFGVAQSELSIVVAQLSRLVGRGRPAVATLLIS